jgi:hypothetical protein
MEEARLLSSSAAEGEEVSSVSSAGNSQLKSSVKPTSYDAENGIFTPKSCFLRFSAYF